MTPQHFLDHVQPQRCGPLHGAEVLPLLTRVLRSPVPFQLSPPRYSAMVAYSAAKAAVRSIRSDMVGRTWPLAKSRLNTLGSRAG